MTDKSKLAKAIDAHKLQCTADLAEMIVTLAKQGCELSTEECGVIVRKHFSSQDEVTGFFVWQSSPEGQAAFTEVLEGFREGTEASSSKPTKKIKKEDKPTMTKNKGKEVQESKVLFNRGVQEIKVEFMRNPLVTAGIMDELKTIMKKGDMTWTQLVQCVVTQQLPKVITQEQLIAAKGDKSWKQFELELIAATFPENKLLANAAQPSKQVQAEASKPSAPADKGKGKGKKSKAGKAQPEDEGAEFELEVPEDETTPVLPNEEL